MDEVTIDLLAEEMDIQPEALRRFIKTMEIRSNNFEDFMGQVSASVSLNSKIAEELKTLKELLKGLERANCPSYDFFRC